MPEGNRRELADLLRSRRARLTPAEVGLPPGVRRRTAGLRREEVASLAGISTTYYTILEQGRDVHPSEQVVRALGGALRLTPAELGHLCRLAGVAVPATTPLSQALDPALADLVARQDPYPTYVKGANWDVLGANRTARVLFTDVTAAPPGERNMLVWMFTDPVARERYADWDTAAAAMLARFRSSVGNFPDDPELRGLVERLDRESPCFRQWWPRHEVDPVAGGYKRLRHPAIGLVRFRHVVLRVAENPNLTMVTFAAGPEVHAALADAAADLPGA